MRVGWRGRIGYLCPSPGVVANEEFRLAVPDGVLVVGAPMLIEAVSVGGFATMLEQVESAAKIVSQAGVDVAVLVGTGAALVPGKDADAEVRERISGVTGVPALTQMGALLEAAKTLGMERPAFAVPYPDEMAAKLGEYFEMRGLCISGRRNLNMHSAREINELDAGVAYRTGREAFAAADNPDGVLIVGGAFRSLEINAALEQDLGCPVTSSNQALIWAALRKIGIRESQPELGRLFGEH